MKFKYFVTMEKLTYFITPMADLIIANRSQPPCCPCSDYEQIKRVTKGK